MFDFVAIDFETANKKHDPCQIGIACVCNGKIADTINSYINPERQFDEICSKIHGISSERHVYTTGRIAMVKLLTVLPIRVSKLLG